jgi:hypothetical protein
MRLSSNFIVTSSCKPGNFNWPDDELFLLSAFCQKPVPGLSNLPMGGIAPMGLLSAHTSATVIAMQIKALMNFI